MREIERRTPIVTGEVKVYYDRGDDYLAGERLMGGDVEMFVMERDGRVVGLGGRAFPPIQVAGIKHRGMFVHRLRLLPEEQGEGVPGPMNALRLVSGAARDSLSYSLVAAGNEAAVRALPGRLSPDAFWPVGASRLILDTTEVAGPAAGRPAVASDVERLVELFNIAHEPEELFVPYTSEWLSTRLLREPDLYSWANIILGERSALGVWPADLGVRREAGGMATSDVRALVLDYGCEVGADDELIALIRAACSPLQEGGTTELSIFSSEPSSVYTQLSRLAKRIEPYTVRCAEAPGPHLDQRGVYVDQLYF